MHAHLRWFAALAVLTAVTATAGTTPARAIAEVLKRRQQRPPVEPVYAPLRQRTRQAFREELDEK